MAKRCFVKEGGDEAVVAGDSARPAEYLRDVPPYTLSGFRLDRLLATLREQVCSRLGGVVSVAYPALRTFGGSARPAEYLRDVPHVNTGETPVKI
jgi:hypothetical protein